MRVSYKWFVIPIILVIAGLILRGVADGSDRLADLGRTLSYLGGLTVSFLLIAWAVTGALRQK